MFTVLILGVAGALTCRVTTPALAGCSVVERELVAPLDIHAEVAVRYAFVCAGHPIGLALASDEATAAIAYTREGEERTLRLKGRGPFRLKDQTPEATFQATLLGPCELELRSVATVPSFEQLLLWQDEARSAAGGIRSLLSERRRARDLAAVLAWDDTRLATTQAAVEAQLRAALPPDLPLASLFDRNGRLLAAADMPPAWNDAVAARPELLDWVLLRAQIAAITLGRPPLYRPEDETRLTASLRAAVRDGEALMARAERWLDELTDQWAELRDALRTAEEDHA